MTTVVKACSQCEPDTGGTTPYTVVKWSMETNSNFHFVIKRVRKLQFNCLQLTKNLLFVLLPALVPSYFHKSLSTVLWFVREELHVISMCNIIRLMGVPLLLDWILPSFKKWWIFSRHYDIFTDSLKGHIVGSFIHASHGCHAQDLRHSYLHYVFQIEEIMHATRPFWHLKTITYWSWMSLQLNIKTRWADLGSS